jgi:hypothetical protein
MYEIVTVGYLLFANYAVPAIMPKGITLINTFTLIAINEWGILRAKIN